MVHTFEQQHQQDYEATTKVYIRDNEYVWLPASIVSMKSIRKDDSKLNTSNQIIKNSNNNTEKEGKIRIDLPSNWSSSTMIVNNNNNNYNKTNELIKESPSSSHLHHEQQYNFDGLNNINHSNHNSGYHRNPFQQDRDQDQQQQQHQHYRVISKHVKGDDNDNDGDSDNNGDDNNENTNSNNSSIMVQWNPEYYEWPLREGSSQNQSRNYDDVADLPYLHEAAVFYNIKERYEQQKLYTRVNRDIIIAMNPFDLRTIRVNLYGQEKQQFYADKIIWEPMEICITKNDDDRSLATCISNDLSSLGCADDSDSARDSNSDSDSDGDDTGGGPSRKFTTFEPHIYEVSSYAYRGLAVDQRNQTIVVSGESGAGKTETIKIILMHLTTIEHTRPMQMPKPMLPSSNHGNDNGISSTGISICSAKDFSEKSLGTKLVESSSILEAFGNAQTVRNNNSSRFGKLLRLQFNVVSQDNSNEFVMTNDKDNDKKTLPFCNLVGGSCQTYLLEKSRVVSHVLGERSFHIFYQLLSSPPKFKNQLFSHFKDSNVEDYKYLIALANTESSSSSSSSAAATSGEKNNENYRKFCQHDSNTWQQTLDGLKYSCNIRYETLFNLMRALVVILQLGNLVFQEKDEGSSIDDKQLEKLSSVIGISKEDLEAALTKRKIKTTHSETTTGISPTAAKNACDAFAMEMYAKIFSYIVRKVNESILTSVGSDKIRNENTANTTPLPFLTKDRDENDTQATISLLDIYGFESFEVNRFQQLCINYANEQLQQKYLLDNFTLYKEEYEPEGINIFDSLSVDNSSVINLLDGGGWNNGIIDLIDGESILPNGNDSSFAYKAKTIHKNHHRFSNNKSSTNNNSKSKGRMYGKKEFAIRHFAGLVKYDAAGFVKQNTDALPDDLINCVASKSTNIFIQSELLQKELGSSQTAGRHINSISDSLDNNRQNTVIGRFRKDIQDLILSMNDTDVRYIRCIKPNDDMIPQVIDHRTTIQQLRFAGVTTAVALSKETFPDKIAYENIMARYRCCYFNSSVEESHKTTMAHTRNVDSDKANPRDTVERMLSVLFRLWRTNQHKKENLFVPQYSHFPAHVTASRSKEQLFSSSSSPPIPPLPTSYSNYCAYGKTKVFFRPGVVNYLEAQRSRVLSRAVAMIQKWTRMVLVMQRYINKTNISSWEGQHKTATVAPSSSSNYEDNSSTINSTSRSTEYLPIGEKKNNQTKKKKKKKKFQRRLSLPLFGSFKPKYKSNSISEGAYNGYFDSLQKKSPVVAAMVEAAAVYDDESLLDYSLSSSSLVEDAYFFDDYGSLFRKSIEVDVVKTTDDYQHSARYGSSGAPVTKNEKSCNEYNSYHGYGITETVQHHPTTGRRLSMPLFRRKSDNTISSCGSNSRGSRFIDIKKRIKFSKLRRRLSLGSLGSSGHRTKKRASKKKIKQKQNKILCGTKSGANHNGIMTEASIGKNCHKPSKLHRRLSLPMFSSYIATSCVVRGSYGPLQGKSPEIVAGTVGNSNNSLQHQTSSKLLTKNEKSSNRAESDNDSCNSFYEYDYDDCGSALGEKPTWAVPSVNDLESLSQFSPSGALITENEKVSDYLDDSCSKSYNIEKNQQQHESLPISRRSSLPSSFGCGSDISLDYNGDNNLGCNGDNDLGYDGNKNLGYDGNIMSNTEKRRKSKSLRRRFSLLFIGSSTSKDTSLEKKSKIQQHNCGKRGLYSKFKRRASAKKNDDKSSTMSGTGNESFSIDSNDSYSSKSNSSSYNNTEKGNQQCHQPPAHQRRLSLPLSSFKYPGSAIDEKANFSHRKSRRRFSLLSVGTRRAR